MTNNANNTTSNKIIRQLEAAKKLEDYWASPEFKKNRAERYSELQRRYRLGPYRDKSTKQTKTIDELVDKGVERFDQFIEFWSGRIDPENRKESTAETIMGDSFLDLGNDVAYLIDLAGDPLELIDFFMDDENDNSFFGKKFRKFIKSPKNRKFLKVVKVGTVKAIEAFLEDSELGKKYIPGTNITVKDAFKWAGRFETIVGLRGFLVNPYVAGAAGISAIEDFNQNYYKRLPNEEKEVYQAIWNNPLWLHPSMTGAAPFIKLLRTPIYNTFRQQSKPGSQAVKITTRSSILNASPIMGTALFGANAFIQASKAIMQQQHKPKNQNSTPKVSKVLSASKISIPLIPKMRVNNIDVSEEYINLMKEVALRELSMDYQTMPHTVTTSFDKPTPYPEIDINRFITELELKVAEALSSNLLGSTA